MTTYSKVPFKSHDSRNLKQRRHDLIASILLIILMVIVAGLIIWLASLGGGTVTPCEPWYLPA